MAATGSPCVVRSAAFACSSSNPIAVSFARVSASIFCTSSNDGGGGGLGVAGWGEVGAGAGCGGGLGWLGEGAGAGFSPFRCTLILISPTASRSKRVVCSWPAAAVPLMESMTSPSLSIACPTPSEATAVTAGGSELCEVSVIPIFVFGCGLYMTTSRMCVGPGGTLVPTTCCAWVGGSGVGISGSASSAGRSGLTISFRSIGGKVSTGGTFSV
mmetsp:Transcript_15913/g.39896  ORF Transcript_15913/g.39896 Transcript_15913/m.39896 type:complete len:214 (-) Transcript_15913:989-1630(-)